MPYSPIINSLEDHNLTPESFDELLVLAESCANTEEDQLFVSKLRKEWDSRGVSALFTDPKIKRLKKIVGL
jgi:hypothetical protein